MTPATTVEPWHKVGVHAFDVDPYTSAAILFYIFRREFESTVGYLPYIIRNLM